MEIAQLTGIMVLFMVGIFVGFAVAKVLYRPKRNHEIIERELHYWQLQFKTMKSNLEKYSGIYKDMIIGQVNNWQFLKDEHEQKKRK